MNTDADEDARGIAIALLHQSAGALKREGHKNTIKIFCSKRIQYTCNRAYLSVFPVNWSPKGNCLPADDIVVLVLEKLLDEFMESTD